MRTTIWMFFATLLVVTAVYGLSLGHSAPHGPMAALESLPAAVDHDAGEHHDGVGTSRYAR